MKRQLVCLLTLLTILSVLLWPPPTAQGVGIDCGSAGLTCSAYAEADRQACIYLYSQDGTLTPAEGAACWDRHVDLYKGCMAGHGCPLNN